MLNLEGRSQGGIAQDLRSLGVTLENVARLLSRLNAAHHDDGRPPVVSVKTAAAWVGMSERGFRKLVARGEVPAAKVGRSYVVLVDLWLERLRVQADDYAPGGGAS